MKNLVHDPYAQVDRCSIVASLTWPAKEKLPSPISLGPGKRNPLSHILSLLSRSLDQRLSSVASTATDTTNSEESTFSGIAMVP